jgi:hypothetical protein
MVRGQMVGRRHARGPGAAVRLVQPAAGAKRTAGTLGAREDERRPGTSASSRAASCAACVGRGPRTRSAACRAIVKAAVSGPGERGRAGEQEQQGPAGHRPRPTGGLRRPTRVHARSNPADPPRERAGVAARPFLPSVVPPGELLRSFRRCRVSSVVVHRPATGVDRSALQSWAPTRAGLGATHACRHKAWHRKQGQSEFRSAPRAPTRSLS